MITVTLAAPLLLEPLFNHFQPLPDARLSRTPQPADFPYAALLVAGFELAGMPFGSALSRRSERIADRYSLQLTNDREAFIQTHLALARTNIADLDPPRVAYYLLFTHPTPSERLALAEPRRR